MREFAINNVLEEMNDALSSTYKDRIFVADIEIDSIEYYYDSESSKIKAKIGVLQNKNNEVFNNKVIEDAFNGFIQVLVNELNDVFTQDEDLEKWVNDAIENIANERVK